MTRARLLFLGFLLMATACQAERARPEPAPAVSAELVAALEQAQGFHHRADSLLETGQADAAIAEIARVLELRFPAGATEGEDVRLDARARLGKLYLERGRLDDAERVVHEGLTGATRDSFFLANLYNVRGELHEARAASLDDPALVKAELKRAIAAYAHGQDINVRVQARVYQEAMP